MPSTAKKKFVVVTAQGKDVEVSATRAEEDETGSIVRLYDGDTLVASFRSFSSLYVEA